jgi:acyl-CoA thioester hydrolase
MPKMPDTSCQVQLRIRYGETDQMGTFANARALEWFEVGRTEYLRGIGLAYTQMEQQGVFLPVVEAHIQYLGRAKYDDLLTVTTSACMCGKARLRFDISIVKADGGASVVAGYTIHAFVDSAGRATRPAEWITQKLPAREVTK